MKIYFDFLVLIILCKGTTTLSPINEDERFTKVRYLSERNNRSIESRRPIFYWDPNPVTRNPIDLIDETNLRKLTNVVPEDERILIDDNRSISHRIRPKSVQVQKKSKGGRRRRVKKTKRKNKNGVLEIPKTAKNITVMKNWDIKNDSQIQTLITELNRNPEGSYENLLGKPVDGLEVKIPRTNETSFSSISRGSSFNTKLTPSNGSYNPRFEPAKGIFRVDLLPNKTNSPFGVKRNFWSKQAAAFIDRLKTQNPGIEKLIPIKEINKIPDIIKKTDFKAILTTLKKRKPSGSSCLHRNGGCEHICNDNDVRICSCLDGYVLAEDGKSCLDINECLIFNGDCNSKCYNTPGSYYCGCPKGYRLGDDLRSCEDVNECLLNNGRGPCQDTCTNTIGSYTCGCYRLNGSKLADDGRTCEYGDDCKSGRKKCSHECVSSHGQSFCYCPDGLELDSDEQTCKDIDECKNTHGSYRCKRNETQTRIQCPAVRDPQVGYIYCIQKAINPYNYQRAEISNNPGTYCQLICPNGYKNVANFHLTCNDEGKWIGEQSGRCSPILNTTYDPRFNYIEVTWAFSKPKITCPSPIHFHLEDQQEIAYVTFEPPKTPIDWKYVEADPKWGKDLEVHLPPANHWVTFKVTDPNTKLTAKCILHIVVDKILK